MRFFTSTLPAVALLLAVIVYGTGEMIHAQLLRLGEAGWHKYHQLRTDPPKPKCDPKALTAAPKAKPETDELDELLEDDEPPPPPEKDELDELLEDETKTSSGAESGDLLDDLLGGEDNAAASAAALEAARKNCIAKHERYKSIQKRITPGVKRFRALEGGIAKIVLFGVNHLRHLLALLLLICAATTTWLREHIALRPPKSKLDHRITNIAQLIANSLLLYSAWSLKRVDETSGVQIEHPELHYIWMIGFLAMIAGNIHNLVKLPKDATENGSPLRATLTIPLYVMMALISGTYFLVKEGHGAGLAIYLGKLTEHALLYIHVGLYVWVGMLLKRTRIAPLCFDVVRPWRLPPELLAFVAVFAAALPTAYSGASGIFVIAVGGVIYDELRRAGSRRQLALAATAMSGSMGVVLRPCLLVVIVASLNKQVTTDQLYGWGFKVFLLTSTLFLAASLLNRQGKMSTAPANVALPASGRAMRPLLPYLLIFGGLLLVYAVLLKAHLDEHSAPVMLPVLLLAVLLYDQRSAQRALNIRKISDPPPRGVLGALKESTSETTGHIGALLMLMGLSVCLGGIVERADLMAMVPETFGSVWLTMMVLVVVLVLIGMTMDPYGAVILVSATIADVAYRNGIDPVHFWMVVLVAFELGYLTPPVALNHLLTRQVVGDEEAGAADEEGETFWARHERILLPVSVMGVALLLVAFIPLLAG